MAINNHTNIPDIYDKFNIDFSSMQCVDNSSDGLFIAPKNADFVTIPSDGKVEFIGLGGKVLAYVKSELGFPCYYPIEPVSEPKEIRSVMMDLDGTTVRSEAFWISIIEQTVSCLLQKGNFTLSNEDIPYVSGHSVSEHLQYCINKYCPDKSIAEARKFYFEITHNRMNSIMNGTESNQSFEPNEGVKDFLHFLKEKNIKIGLVTSGLYEKAYPEILSAFRTMGFSEKPEDFYDSIITAGQRLTKGSTGTLGELEPKPHPWLYAETYNIGLGTLFTDRNTVIGIEDSSAGVYSVRLSNVFTIGISGGNIIQSGAYGICNKYCSSFMEIQNFISELND